MTPCGQTSSNAVTERNRDIRKITSLLAWRSCLIPPPFQSPLRCSRCLPSLNLFLAHSVVYYLWTSSLTVYFAVLRQGVLSADTKNLLEDKSLEPGLVTVCEPEKKRLSLYVRLLRGRPPSHCQTLGHHWLFSLHYCSPVLKRISSDDK